MPFWYCILIGRYCKLGILYSVYDGVLGRIVYITLLIVHFIFIGIYCATVLTLGLKSRAYGDPSEINDDDDGRLLRIFSYSSESFDCWTARTVADLRPSGP